jgi:hypothetical protein
MSSACSDTNSRLQQHQEKLDSLTSTTTAVATAWLDGNVSGTYGHTALEQTLLLVEQERTAVASNPKTLADRRGGRLSDVADRLSRLIATTIRDVDAADAAAVRQHVDELSKGSAEQK